MPRAHLNGGGVKYFENSSMHWSLGVSKFGVKLDNPFWIEVARKVNNKGLVCLGDDSIGCT